MGNLKKNQNLIIVIILITVLNILIGSMSASSGAGYHLNGDVATKIEIKKAFVITLLITVPLLGFVFGFIMRIILKLINRPKDYISLVLFITAGINGLLLITQIWGIIRTA